MSKPTQGMTGRIWLGYWLIVMAPAVSWVLEDTTYMMRKHARAVCVIVLLIGVVMTRPADH